jgi:hypothetical protein
MRHPKGDAQVVEALSAKLKEESLIGWPQAKLIIG